MQQCFWFKFYRKIISVLPDEALLLIQAVGCCFGLLRYNILLL